jgi:cell division protein ZapA (FtsZ GTPase activity inhibitor)
MLQQAPDYAQEGGGKTMQYYDVEVGGHAFRVASERGAEYIKAVAAYVEQKLRARAQASKPVTPVRLALMAALEITDELFERDRDSRRAEDQTRQLQ